MTAWETKHVSDNLPNGWFPCLVGKRLGIAPRHGASTQPCRLMLLAATSPCPMGRPLQSPHWRTKRGGGDQERLIRFRELGTSVLCGELPRRGGDGPISHQPFLLSFFFSSLSPSWCLEATSEAGTQVTCHFADPVRWEAIGGRSTARAVQAGSVQAGRKDQCFHLGSRSG